MTFLEQVDSPPGLEPEMISSTETESTPISNGKLRSAAVEASETPSDELSKDLMAYALKSPSTTSTISSSSTLHGKAAEERINMLRDEIGIVQNPLVNFSSFPYIIVVVNTSKAYPSSLSVTSFSDAPPPPYSRFPTTASVSSSRQLIPVLQSHNFSPFLRMFYKRYLTNHPMNLLAPVALGPYARSYHFKSFNLARKTTSLKHLEQLAQELPRLSPSGRPLSMSSSLSSAPSSPLLTKAPNPLHFGDIDVTSTAVVAAQTALNGIASPTTSSITNSSFSNISSSPTSTTSSYPQSGSGHYSKGSITNNMAYEANVARTNWATTSHVIEHLQQTIDALRRDLNEQTARAVEEKQGRDAIRKRCDNIESQLEGLRHQNETLNAIINRKERRVKELEKEIESKNRHVETLENDQRQYIESKNEYESMLKQVKEDEERAGAAYKVVVDGARSVRAMYEQKFAEINEQVRKLIEERVNDKERIAQLRNVVDHQKAERTEMQKIQEEMKLQRARHIQEVTALMEGFREKLAESEKESEIKVKETLSLVDEMKKTHIDFTRHFESDTTTAGAN